MVRVPSGDPQTSAQLIGREAELAAVERFLDGSADAQALTIVGEAGIGKTTLWEAAVARARERGCSVLCARANETEATLSFAGLADLLDGVDLQGLTGLPAPQREALEVALRRTERADAPPEPFAFAVGFLTTVRLLAAPAGLVIAVDDVRVLDRPSRDALVFAARRIAGQPVRFVLSRRAGSTPELETALERAGVERLEMGPLRFGAIVLLLTRRFGRELPRRLLRAVFESARGNPLFALELARTLVERGVSDIGDDVPLPARLEEPFGSRVAALSPPLRRVLLATSLSGGLSRSTLAQVTDPLAVEDALAAGLVTVERAHVRPSHPLLAVAAKQDANARERRDLHQALAGAVTDETLRACHLALAAVGPDAALAAEIAAASVAASERGAAQDAVELAAHALRLTAENAPAWSERLLALARCMLTTGDFDRIVALLAPHAGRLPTQRARAEAELLLAESAPEVTADEAHAARALAQCPDDPWITSWAHGRLATMLAAGHVERIADAEKLALAGLPAAAVAGIESEHRLLTALAWTRILQGRPVGDLVGRHQAPPAGLSLHASAIERPAAIRLMFRGELARARSVFRRLLSLADERGETLSRAYMLVPLSELEMRAGDVPEAARIIEELDVWTGAVGEEHSAVCTRLLVTHAAIAGHPQRVIRDAPAADAAAASWGGGWDRLEIARARGIAALCTHEFERAAEHLRVVWEHTVREGIDDPGAFPVAADLVEALVQSGDSGGAAVVTERLRALARAQDHPWGLATAKRCEATVALGSGYADDAAALLRKAADRYGELGLGFDRGRSLLLLGRAQRRFKRRGEARQTLEQAEGLFAACGCDGWAAQARSETARISGRRSADEDELTPSERRVVELAANGLSNKEIATQLFLSVATVASYLSRAYIKLGVRSRAQLARRLGTPS